VRWEGEEQGGQPDSSPGIGDVKSPAGLRSASPRCALRLQLSFTPNGQAE
jgi:hypothetical protein